MNRIALVFALVTATGGCAVDPADEPWPCSSVTVPALGQISHATYQWNAAHHLLHRESETEIDSWTYDDSGEIAIDEDTDHLFGGSHDHIHREVVDGRITKVRTTSTRPDAPEWWVEDSWTYEGDRVVQIDTVNATDERSLTTMDYYDQGGVVQRVEYLADVTGSDPVDISQTIYWGEPWIQRNVLRDIDHTLHERTLRELDAQGREIHVSHELDGLLDYVEDTERSPNGAPATVTFRGYEKAVTTYSNECSN
jgi:hypothetical protein